MKIGFNNTIKLLFGLTIGLILMLLWAKLINVGELLRYISEVRVIFVLPAISFYLLSYFLRSERLRKLLSHKAHIPVFRNYTYVLAGNFLNYFIPIRAGEIAKCIFYKKNHQMSYADSLPSIFIHKLFDTFAIFFVLLLIPFSGVVLSAYLNALLILLIIVFLLGVSILIITSANEDYLVKILKSIFFFLPEKYKDKINAFIHLFVQGLAIFKHHKKLFIPCIVLTFTATLSDSLFFYLMFSAFEIEISFLKVLFGYTLIFLSYVIPHPPAQIGSNQFIMILIFSIGLGYNENLVSAVMSFTHLSTLIVILITGTFSLYYAGTKFIDIIKKKEPEDG